MTSAERSEAAAAARSALAQAKRDRAAEQLGLPSLHLLIWPTADCMRISLVVYYSRPGQRRTCKVLRDASWSPREVTELKLVQWAHRALESWLSEQAMDPLDMQ